MFTPGYQPGGLLVLCRRYCFPLPSSSNTAVLNWYAHKHPCMPNLAFNRTAVTSRSRTDVLRAATSRRTR